MRSEQVKSDLSVISSLSTYSITHIATFLWYCNNTGEKSFRLSSKFVWETKRFHLLSPGSYEQGSKKLNVQTVEFSFSQNLYDLFSIL